MVGVFQSFACKGVAIHMRSGSKAMQWGTFIRCKTQAAEGTSPTKIRGGKELGAVLEAGKRIQEIWVLISAAPGLLGNVGHFCASVSPPPKWGD